MPRSNHPRRQQRRASKRGPSGSGSSPNPGGWNLEFGADAGWRHHGWATLQEFADGTWHVRGIASYGALKEYRCPGCGQVIPPGVSHLVAWRADGPRSDRDAEADRRHWHRRCWEHHSPRR